MVTDPLPKLFVQGKDQGPPNRSLTHTPLHTSTPTRISTTTTPTRCHCTRTRRNRNSNSPSPRKSSHTPPPLHPDFDIISTLSNMIDTIQLETMEANRVYLKEELGKIAIKLHVDLRSYLDKCLAKVIKKEGKVKRKLKKGQGRRRTCGR